MPRSIPPNLPHVVFIGFLVADFAARSQRFRHMPRPFRIDSTFRQQVAAAGLPCLSINYLVFS